MRKILLITLVVAFLSSCQTKESYISSLNEFIEDVKNDCANYTDKDWERADKKLEKLTKETYKEFAEELSFEEKKEVAKCQTAYAAMKAKAGIKNMSKNIEEAAKKLDEAMKE